MSFSSLYTFTHRHAVCVCMCVFASEIDPFWSLATQGGWFNLCSAGALWLLNPWRASFNGDMKGQVGTQMMRQPTKTSVSHHKHSPPTCAYTHKHTHKALCVYVWNHPDREHEILMTNITLYTHTNNEMLFAGGTTMVCQGEKWGERNVNNLQGGNTPLYINTLLSP